ncbi:MAG TPA: zf-HC2 domain-containing protein [Syntrophobacteraceae bacterium]|nr:zf-HC2 domain-containing protein [Syntrophobacteraceae bacterium]
MNDEEFKKLLKEVGDMYRNMEPSPDCPPDDMLLDYVYMELSKAEREKVKKHINQCDRCRFEILKMEADRAVWEKSFRQDPDAAIEQALGPDGVRRVREAMIEAATQTRTALTFDRRLEPVPLEPNQDTVDRIAAAAAAEVLDNVDLHIAHWLKTRGDQPRPGPYTGLAQASGLGGDILPFIDDAIRQAWEWCAGNRNDLVAGILSPALLVHVSSFFHESKGLSGLNDKEIDVLTEVISKEVADIFTGEPKSDADG